MPEVKIDRRTKEYKDMLAGGAVEPMGGKVIPRPKKRKVRDYSHLKCGSVVDGVWVNDFNLCMHCGRDNLEKNEDGSPKFRRQPESCYECVWRNDV